ncbi:FAD/NAD(P)-binding domain-containing protein [Penicillium angulare]|uniref:FAD/NAD(P)-binding domain-containing protein n=1 Tax=Penicillium angulare TaxID=116970 RepID=UPI00254213EE|nr:FAD/NAD(P)-binding domain-containing protein [Penicillium angulare]KAJ5280230.1 FAD/NAD(P)-binding domain-containing protein [Penicillium angulare]
MLQRTCNTILALWFIFPFSFGFCEEETFYRDVAIIGGGASGTFAALKLKEQGKSIIVIEKENSLGGHTNTYQDPGTRQTAEYGVQVFHNQLVVRDLFKRLNVSWTIAILQDDPFPPRFLDPKTAEPVHYSSPNATAALGAYAAQLAKYPDLERGFFLPDPVPEDLLTPFGEFLQKYPDIQDATFIAFSYGQGLGDYLKQPTLYVFKNFGLDIVRDISSGFIVTANHNNYDIYARAAEVLQRDLLLNSIVASTTQRDDNGVDMNIRTPNGNTRVLAKKLLITIPPKLENLGHFALDHCESITFARFNNTGYYSSLVNNTGLPQNFTAYSVSPDTQQNIPILPGVYNVVPTSIDGVFAIKYGSPSSLSDDYVKREIISYVKKLQANGHANPVSGDPTFVAYANHDPFELTVSPAEIARGFYRDFYSLQGYRSTWYTGAAFHTQDSSMLWRFTDSYVLPPLLKSFGS